MADLPNTPYAELHCRTNFSFLTGASHPEELVQQAAMLGYRALAITDECSLAGVVRAHKAIRDHALALHLIVGAEFRLNDGLRVILLAPDRRAYGELCRLITLGRRRAAKGAYALEPEDLRQSGNHCLLLWLANPLQEAAREQGHWLKRHFASRLWLVTERLLDAEDANRHRALLNLAERLKLPLVCANDVHMHTPARQPLQDVLTAIRHGCTLAEAGYRLFPNAERHLRSLKKISRLYSKDQIEETTRIARQCTFSLDELRYEYPDEVVPRGLSAQQYLKQLVQQGLQRRYLKAVPIKVKQLIDKELALIAECQYAHYFLTIHDIVHYARSQNILCQGRGSAANSAVCYCLGITEVNPDKVELLFERFISKERNEPPDIDVDFESDRREEVIQYIYHKYGRERAALAATVVTYRAKSAIREVGKALGLDVTLLEYMINHLDWRDRDQDWVEQLANLKVNIAGTVMTRFVQLVSELRGFPRHLSQHVGGFVISQGPMHALVPIENAAMDERTVIQWDKDDLEALGLMKVDVLGLGMLSAIRYSLALIERYRGRPMSVADIPREDPAVYAMLQRGDSIGVFQVESRAQTSMLPRLKPACYYDLVIQVAIVRPGPIQGDMVHPFLKRRDGLEPVTYPKPEVEAVLKRTMGVPIFQEQAIKLAMVAAGFSGGEADQLRRAMAAWKRTGQLVYFKEKLLKGMRQNGYDDAFAQRLYQQIMGFGEYGFPESHAASFALLVYISAWLKCHEPAAFCCGLLNAQPMGFYSPSQLVQDARRHGVQVLPVDINYSQWDHCLDQTRMHQGQPALRLGLRLVKGLRQQTGERIVQQRPTSGYADLPQLQRRAHLNTRDMQALAAADTLQALSQHRYQAQWDVLGMQAQLPLLSDLPEQSAPIQLPAPAESAALLEDFHALGLSLGRHPMALLREQNLLPRCLTADALTQVTHGQYVNVAGLVTCRQRPGTASGVTFVTLEDETGHINVVVWVATARAQRQALLTSHLLKVQGRLEREGDVIHIIAGKLTNLNGHWQTLTVKSRDFH